MNMKNLIIVIVVLFSASVAYLKFVDSSDESVENVQVRTQEPENNDALAIEKSEKTNKLDKSLLHIAQMISPPSDVELEVTWEDEFTCSTDEKCNTFIFNARSYEDALWLKRKGYPSKSTVAMLRDLSKTDLRELSEHGNVNAKNLLAIDSLQNKNVKKAKSYARSSTAHAAPGETFGYRLLAEAMIMDKDPMNATLNLRIASILGDTNATATYERITAGSSSALIDNTNQLAYSYLLSWFNTDINNLNNDPRPSGSNGDI